MEMLLKDLKINPLRSFLTAFSMLIGILAVIASVLIGTVGKSYLEATNEQLFGRTPAFSIQLHGTDFGQHSTLAFFTERLKNTGNATALQVSPQDDIGFSLPATSADPILRQQQVLAGTKRVETIYTTAGYRELFNLPLVQGRWFTDESEFAYPEIVLNKQAVMAFSNPRLLYAVGKNTHTPTPLHVVGVINDGQDLPRMYVNVLPLSLVSPDLLNAEAATVLWLNKTASQQQSIREYITDAVTDLGSGEVAEIQEQKTTASYDGVLDMLQLSVAVTAALLLFVSAVGLVNIGLASLEQRTHELLIRRALGATRGSIARLVLGGALLLSVLVACFAILLSIVLVNLAGSLLPDDSPVAAPQYPYWAAVIAITASVLTAFVGGIFPAVKAARLQPALALR